MAKRKLYARLRYCKKEDGREGYSIEVRSGNGEWGLDTWFPLFARDGGNGQTDYVHWSILSKLNNLQQLGYEIDLDF